MIALMCIGLIWGALIISTTTAIVQEVDKSASVAKDRQAALDAFSIKSRLPKSLKLRIHE